ncbi:MAG: hypothetical protein V6Z89_06180 [Desulfobacter sp.]
MSGLLTQALENLTAEQNHIKGLTGLPPDAAQIQTDAVNLVNRIVPQVKTLQSNVSAFTAKALPQLNEANQALENKTPLDQIKSMVLPVKSMAQELQSSVADSTGTFTSAMQEVNGYPNRLAGVVNELNQQKTELQGKLNNARSEESATKKKYYYLIALGPFGLIGLAAALALWQTWKSKVSDLESEQSRLSAQISTLNSFVAAINQIQSDFTDLVNKINNVKNSLDILAGDISNTITDLEDSSHSSVAQVYISAAIAEVNTLAKDAA